MSDYNCNKDQTNTDISVNTMPCDTTSDKSPVCSCCSMKHTDRSARDIRAGKDETIDELVATLQKLMK